MKDIKFPIFKTKIKGETRRFNLIDPQERQAYFKFKAGPEIEKLREYLKENSFVAYLLGKKSSGKGTYSQMFAEVVNPERIFHLSIGDMVRDIDKELADARQRKELLSFLQRDYRGWISLEEVISALEKRSTKTLLPTEAILALVKREIARREKKSLFIDGFPRDLDQISFSLFFRDLIGYRDDPDIFILIDVPESVIDERIKNRRVCPICQTSRNLKLFPTKKVHYEKKSGEFYLLCDNPNCKEVKMTRKEGDKFGIEPIRERLEMDEKLTKQAISLYGIPKIFLRNSIPITENSKYVDSYEITPEYHYEWIGGENRVRVIEKPWEVLDDEGIPSHSLLPSPVAVSLIKQMAEVLNL